MSLAQIELAFGDGAYTFRLGLAQIEELQRKSGVGIGALCARLLQGRYTIAGKPVGSIAEAAFSLSDVVEPIRQGLIGGGAGLVDGLPIKVTPLIANQLIDAYVIGRPLAEAWSVAVAVISATMEGYSPPGGAEPPKAAAPEGKQAQTGGSITPGPSSTAP